jgi:hypothetical protein
MRFSEATPLRHFYDRALTLAGAGVKGSPQCDPEGDADYLSVVRCSPEAHSLASR